MRIHRAVQRGDLREIRELIASFADVNEHSVDHYPPLHIACRGGDLQVVRLLLENGADVNIRYNSGSSFDGETCIHIAARRDDYEMAELLMNYGADVNARDIKTQTTAYDTARSPAMKRMFERKSEERWQSFCMGFHNRLGAQSILQTFPRDLLPKVWQFAQPISQSNTTPTPTPTPPPPHNNNIQPALCKPRRPLVRPKHFASTHLLKRKRFEAPIDPMFQPLSFTPTAGQNVFDKIFPNGRKANSPPKGCSGVIDLTTED
eukprot:c21155_g1_i1.p1 GENE.c21155_g1_i1~~c21155_g1_i1.p1  ORF type:complete len:262 (+),score=43.64 c21155_g1_i1:21-806(+)